MFNPTVQTIAPMSARANFFLGLVLPNLDHRLTLLHTNCFFFWERTFTCTSITGGPRGSPWQWSALPCSTPCDLFHELLHSLPHCTYSTLLVATHGGVHATHMLLHAALLLVPLGKPCPLHLLLLKPIHTPSLLLCHELQGLELDPPVRLGWLSQTGSWPETLS